MMDNIRMMTEWVRSPLVACDRNGYLTSQFSLLVNVASFKQTLDSPCLYIRFSPNILLYDECILSLTRTDYSLDRVLDVLCMSAWVSSFRNCKLLRIKVSAEWLICSPNTSHLPKNMHACIGLARFSLGWNKCVSVYVRGEWVSHPGWIPGWILHDPD